MTSKPITLPGFRDFAPTEAKKRQWLKNKLLALFESWGYDPLETPTLEPLAIFAGNIGEDEKLFFKFQDSGGREVALRYDQTVPTCRFVSQNYHQLVFPFKRYQIQNCFRAEKPQKGRFREFSQVDADIFGTASPYADAEVIALSLDIYRRLGFKEATVLINDRSLLRSLPYEALVSIDKLKKIGKDGVLKEMLSRGISPDDAQAYFNTVLNLQPNESIKIILEYLENLGFERAWFKFDPTIIRSFSYSTGPIWEVIIPGYSPGSVLGGERYDGLVGKIAGIDIPATGFAVGFDRTLEAADQFGLIPKMKTSTVVLVTIFSPPLWTKSLQITSLFQNNEVNCELYPDPTAKLDKQIKYADKKGIPFVIIVGPEEEANGLVTLKDLIKKQQTTLTIEAAVKEVSN